MYGFKLTQPVKVIGSTAEDDYNIYIPSGFDNQDLVDSVAPANPNWKLDTPLEDIFEKTTAAHKQASKNETELKAEDNVIFFKTLKFQLAKPGAGVSRTSVPPATNSTREPVMPTNLPNLSGSGVSSTKAEKSPSTSSRYPKDTQQRQTHVRAFFRSLLSGPGTRPPGGDVRANAQQALANMTNKKGPVSPSTNPGTSSPQASTTTLSTSTVPTTATPTPTSATPAATAPNP